ncbi:MAG: hypothetical protein AAF902_00670 [Chloroflexota bacterium]
MLSLDKQNELREEYRQLRPDWRPATELYADLVRSHLTPTSELLDLGCGRGGLIEQLVDTHGRDLLTRTIGVSLNARLKVGDWESTRVSVSDWATLVNAAAMYETLGDEWKNHPAALIRHGGEHVALSRLWESQWRNFRAELGYEATQHDVAFFGVQLVKIERVEPDDEDVIEEEFVEDNPLAAAAVAVLTAGN